VNSQELTKAIEHYNKANPTPTPNLDGIIIVDESEIRMWIQNQWVPLQVTGEKRFVK